jgi:cold shock CspA family protein
VGTEERLKTGTVTKIVRSYGASWGRIAVTGGPLTYFNETSFADADDFDALTEGDAVVFELVDDPVNGSRAVAIEIQPAAALEATGSEA